MITNGMFHVGRDRDVPLQQRVDALLAEVQQYDPRANVSLIKKAAEWAIQAHDGQQRKSGQPYIIHPLSVGFVITRLQLDVASVCAALLHDSVEDTSTTVAQLKENFGEDIAFLVDGVTKLGQIALGTREERQAENFRKMLIAMAKDIRVILIKLADRLDNMRTLEFVPVDNQERIARETMEIYAPISNRLGIYWLRSELEDLGFRYLYPAEYRQLTNLIARGDKPRQRYVKDIERTLRRLMSENNITCEIQGRSKSLWGIYEKMRKGNRSIDEVFDIVAFRVLTKNIRDCYAALGVVHEAFTPIPGRIKDYVAMPKPNHYQSLHTVVVGPNSERMEVQIRTHEMHRVADQGVAAHWVYKEGKSLLSPTDQQKFGWLRQLVEFQRDLRDPAEFLDAVKIDLFSDEVYVLTPKGDVKAFPKGSTPIDFAYHVHTEVGNHCSGARINGQLVPLRYELQMGDTVEILTNPHQKPNKDWLKHAVTARARAKIRHYIRTERRTRGRSLGRDLLERELRRWGHSFAKLQKQGRLKEAASVLRLGDREEDLILQLGFGKITPAQVIRALFPDQGEEEEAPAPKPDGAISRLINKVRGTVSSSGIRVQGEGDTLVRFAHCCCPLPGDAITGFITRGRGVTVHKLTCSNALDLDPDRRIEVTWDEDANVEHPVTIRVHSGDKQGMLVDLSRVFTERKFNIAEANCRATSDGRAINTFHFRVVHLKKLREVMRALERVPGVFYVERAVGD